MASVIELILHPSRRRPDPAPLAVDLTKVFLVGLGAWVVALVVTWFRWRSGDVASTSVWTCVAGVVLGLVALVWARTTRPSKGD